MCVWRRWKEGLHLKILRIFFVKHKRWKIYNGAALKSGLLLKALPLEPLCSVSHVETSSNPAAALKPPCGFSFVSPYRKKSCDFFRGLMVFLCKSFKRYRGISTPSGVGSPSIFQRRKNWDIFRAGRTLKLRLHVAVCSNLSQSIKMLRQVIFTTAPLSKKITGFFSIYLMSRKNRKIFAKKEQSHSEQANRFICLCHSGAHCDAC